MINNELRLRIIEEYSKTKNIKELIQILKIGNKIIRRVLIEENLYVPKVRGPYNNSFLNKGNRFGRWKVLETNIQNHEGRYMTKVICECGTENLIRTQHLLEGTSLGCRHCINNTNYPTFRKTRSNPDINLKGLSPSWLSSIKNNLNRGIKKKIPLEINIYDLLAQLEKQNFKCAYTGTQLNVLKTTKHLSNASLDRIDSTKGYTKDNIQWITKTVNIMKNMFSEKEFLETCFQIYKFKYDNFEPSQDLNGLERCND